VGADGVRYRVSVWTVELSAKGGKSGPMQSRVVVRHATGERKKLTSGRGERLCVRTRSLGRPAGTRSGDSGRGGHAVADFLFDAASARSAAQGALRGRCDVGRRIHEEIAGKAPGRWPPRPSENATVPAGASLVAADHTVLFYGILGAHAAVQIRAGSHLVQSVADHPRPNMSSARDTLAGSSALTRATDGETAVTGATAQLEVSAALGQEPREATPLPPRLPTHWMGLSGDNEGADILDGAEVDWDDGQEHSSAISPQPAEHASEECHSEGVSAEEEGSDDVHDLFEGVPLTVLPVGAFRCEHEAGVTAFIAVSLRPPAAGLQSGTGASSWAIVSCALAPGRAAMPSSVGAVVSDGSDQSVQGVLPSPGGCTVTLPDEEGTVGATPVSDGAAEVGNWSCSHCSLGHHRRCDHIARAVDRCVADLRRLVTEGGASSIASGTAYVNRGSRVHEFQRISVLPMNGRLTATWGHVPHTDRHPRSIVVFHDIPGGGSLQARCVCPLHSVRPASPPSLRCFFICNAVCLLDDDNLQLLAVFIA
jgi:hypothetical protein